MSFISLGLMLSKEAIISTLNVGVRGGGVMGKSTRRLLFRQHRYPGTGFAGACECNSLLRIRLVRPPDVWISVSVSDACHSVTQLAQLARLTRLTRLGRLARPSLGPRLARLGRLGTWLPALARLTPASQPARQPASQQALPASPRPARPAARQP